MIRRHFGDGSEDWSVQCVDTGAHTDTGGRIKRLQSYLHDETFLLTWTACVSDLDIVDLVRFHRDHGRLATVTAVHPPARFGQLLLEGDVVADFAEKPPQTDWINGGLFVLEPKVLDTIRDDNTSWERGPLVQLARERQLMAYRHESFWHCMDTQYDQRALQELWETGHAPWKTWS